MESRWNRKYFYLQIVISVVLLLLGYFSTGIAGSKKNLLQPKKSIVQKVSPAATKIVRAKQLPDLSISNIKITPAKPIVTEKIIVTAIVKNSGTGNCPPSSLKIQIGGKIYPLIHVPGLGHNKTWRYKTKLNIKRQGNYRITAVINPNKKIVEINYKNNTLIKNFRVKKESLKPKLKRRTPPASQPPTPVTPPPSGSTPVDGPIPYSIIKLQAKPIEVSMVSEYHAKILEFGVRHEQEGYYWELLYENTGSESLPQWGYFVQVHQISIDGSEQMAGREWVLGPLSPGNTSELIDEMAWQKEDDTVSLRVTLWQTIHTGNHRFITSKTIPFPMDITFVPVKVAPAIKVSIDLIRTLGVEAPGTPAYWQAEVKNIGLGNIPANTLKIKARQYQMQSPSQLATAPFAIIHAMRPGQHRGFQANWTPIVGCTHLEIIVMDNNDKVLTKKMYPVEFPRLQSVPREIDFFVPKQPLQMQQNMHYIKVAEIESVKHTENPVDGFDYSFQVNCKKLLAGELSSDRIAIVLYLADSEGNKFWKGTWHTGHPISTNYFFVKGTFKYKEAHDTIIFEMRDTWINKTISWRSFKGNSLPSGN